MISLHRADVQPDWAGVATSKRNFWQRLAIRTNGIITPGNAVSVISLGLVLLGLGRLLGHHFASALILVGSGRLGDLADGWVAEQTGTKSPLGEAVDATADKIGTFLTPVAVLLAIPVPAWLIIGLILPHLIIATLSLVAFWRGRRLHPSRLGKLSMALAWVGRVLVVAARAIGQQNAAMTAAEMVMVASIGLGFAALGGYARGQA